MRKEDRDTKCSIKGPNGEVLFDGTVGKMHDYAKWLRSPKGKAWGQRFLKDLHSAERRAE